MSTAPHPPSSRLMRVPKRRPLSVLAPISPSARSKDTMDPYLTRELSLSEASDRLERAGIGGRVIEARACAGGVSNFNHQLVLADGSRLLLRTYEARGPSADEGRRTELAIDPVLSAFRVAAPHVVAAPD